MLKNLDTDGTVGRWFKDNFSDEDKNLDEKMAEYFSLSENDIEKFNSKKKVKKSEDSDNK